MKKLLTIGLTLLTCSIALADMGGRGPVPGPVARQGEWGRGGDGRRGDPLQVCLYDLHSTQSQLQICQDSRVDTRELDRLRFENENLRKENLALRDQLDHSRRDPFPTDPRDPFPQDPRDPRNPRDPRGSNLGFFSYASCKDFQGGVDLKFVGEGQGMFQLEAETAAKQKVASKFSCNYGITTAKSEEIRSQVEVSYCVAGCKDFQGGVDQKFIQSGRGRNQTEAEFNAIKAVGQTFNCNYGIKVQACQ